MKIYITLPYDPNGIEEREADLVDGFYWSHGSGINANYHIENGFLHFDREIALVRARQLRAEWIAKTAAEAARVASFPLL